MADSEINTNPVQGEFFSSAAGLPQRFVRESIQNSLDAMHSGPVRVRFSFSGEKGMLDERRSAPYLEGLRPHLSAALTEASATDRAEEADEITKLLNTPMKYLVVEDFGTTGLRGDVLANRPMEENNDFWGFFRSSGISPKGDDAGGSWGLGKWVFADASRINSVLGFTRRIGEDATLCMGQAILKIHESKGNKYPADGSFSLYTEDSSALPMPASTANDDAEQAAFVRGAVADFQLKRRDDHGLSVVIPYPREELTKSSDDLIRAVISQYFYPIVKGRLEVEFAWPNEAFRRIDADSIESDVKRLKEAPDAPAKYQLAALARAIAFARWTTSVPVESYFPVDVLGRKHGGIGGISDDALKELRARFNEGERLAFRSVVKVEERREEGRQAEYIQFCVYIERDDELKQNESHDYYIRGDISIPEMEHVKRYPARALVHVDSKTALGKVLRAAEGPAHTKWNPRAQRVNDGWVSGYESVFGARHAAEWLLKRLVDPPKELQRDVLADLFPGNVSRRGAKSKKQGQSGNSEPSGKSVLDIRPLKDANGFVVMPTGNDIARSRWRLRCAYDLARGGANTAFNRFEQGAKNGVLDFSFENGGLKIDTWECGCEIISHNELRVEVMGKESRLKVTGFDGRDVVVKLEREGDAEAAA